MTVAHRRKFARSYTARRQPGQRRASDRVGSHLIRDHSEPVRHFLRDSRPHTGNVPGRILRRESNLGDADSSSTPAGRHFLQIPGPTNVPDRILRVIERPTIDHRGPEFGRLGERVLSGLHEVFRTRSNVLIFPSSGTGAWEAALVNTLSPGDTVLMCETGHFSTLWSEMARRLGPLDRRDPWKATGAPAPTRPRIEARLAEDRGHADQGGSRSCTTRPPPG